jgi:hypothetical protein
MPKGLSQDDLAYEAEISRSYTCGYISPTTLFLIWAYLIGDGRRPRALRRLADP